MEAVAEGLVPGSILLGTPPEPPLDACRVAGEELARAGASLAEAHESLRTTWRVLLGSEPGAYALGYVDGGRSPMTILSGDPGPPSQSFRPA